MSKFTLQEVVVRFGAQEALGGVTLTVAQGERVALVGPSGSGKSTLLRTLVAAAQPAGGTVAVDGRDLSGLSAAEVRVLRTRIGFIHQHLGLVPNLRAAQNVATGRIGSLSLGRSIAHVFWPGRAARQEIERLLGRLGLAGRGHTRTDRLSGGQQQRVAIARALWQQPEALLADEPVSSLDPARARAMLGLLTRLSTEDGLTLLVSLHQLDLAREFFPRLIGLRAGRVIFDRAGSAVGDEEFRALYELSDGEIIDDGCPEPR
ncbi:MAG: phosphonate ABC transporter ATP-binding protein [Verrucomicrobiales bacterium]